MVLIVLIVLIVLMVLEVLEVLKFLIVWATSWQAPGRKPGVSVS